MKMCKHTHLYFLRNFKLFHIHNQYYQFPRQATISTLLNDILSKIQERFRVFSREFQGCFKEVSKESYPRSKRVLRVVQKGSKKILKLFHGCIKGVSRLSELSLGIFKVLIRLPPYLMYLSYMSNIIGIIIFFRQKIVLHFWYYHLTRPVLFNSR